VIRKVDDKEILTSLEARKKYQDKFIGFVTVEQKITDPENERIRVMYTADGYDESFKMPAKTESGDFISIAIGMGVGGTMMGGICFDE